MVSAHQRQIASAGIVQVGVIGDEIAVADIQGGTEHADLVEKFDRRHLMFANDVVKFQDAVSGVGRHRNLEFVRKAQGFLKQLNGRRLHLAGDQKPSNAIIQSAVVLLNEFDGPSEAAKAAFEIAHALEPAILVSDPSPAIISRSEVATRSKTLDLLHQS